MPCSQYHFTPVLPPFGHRPRRPRGGPRPGAGAPRGNLNALKTGLRSERIRRGLLLIALLPDVQILLRQLKRQKAERYREEFNKVIAAAYRASNDPELFRSIKEIIAQSLAAGAFPIRPQDPPAKK